MSKATTNSAKSSNSTLIVILIIICIGAIAFVAFKLFPKSPSAPNQQANNSQYPPGATPPYNGSNTGFNVGVNVNELFGQIAGLFGNKKNKNNQSNLANNNSLSNQFPTLFNGGNPFAPNPNTNGPLSLSQYQNVLNN